MDLNSLISAIGVHNWLLLVMILAVYARTLFSAQSKFPITLPPNWLPVFSGVAGAVITSDAAFMGGKPVGGAILLGAVGFVSGGFADGLIVAIFGNAANAPTWAKAIVFVVDDVLGGGSGPASRPRVKVAPLNAVERAANDLGGPTKPTARMIYRSNARGSVSMRLAWPIWVKPLLVSTATLVVLAVPCTVLAVGCVNGVPTPQTQAIVTASGELALCVEGVYQTDESQTPPVAMVQVVVDEGVKCGPLAAALLNAIGQEVTSANQAAVIAQAHAGVVAKMAAKKGL